MNDRPRIRGRKRARTAVALVATAGMVLGLVVPNVAANASTPTRTGSNTPAGAGTLIESAQAQGRFLGGSAAGVPLDDILTLVPAAARYPGSPGPDLHPLSATVLNAVNVSLGNGLNLLGSNGILRLGAVNQYAVTTPDGTTAPTGFAADVTSYGSSGAVTDGGAIAVDDPAAPPADATLDLTGLLGDAGIANTAISNVGVTVGAMAAAATATNTPAQSGSYQIAGATATIKSPILAGIVGTIENAVYGPTGSVQSAVNGLLGSEGGLVGAILNLPVLKTLLINNPLATVTATATLDLDLQAAVHDLLNQTLTSADGAVTINLSDGTVTVDLDALSGGLNNRAPNTEVLSAAVLQAISDDVTTLVSGLVTNIETAVQSALDAATLHIAITATLLGSPLASIVVDGTLAQVLDGTATATITLPLGLSLDASTLLGALAGTLNSVLFNTTGALGTLADTLQTGVVDPVTNALAPALDALDKVVSLKVNGQSTGSAFTETALTITLLPTAAPPLAQVALASATVGPDVPMPTPTAQSLNPNHGPAAGGTTVTITGTGFVSGTTTVTFGGTTIPASSVTVVSGTSLKVTSPSHVPGPVQVTVSNGPGLTSGPLTYTYDPVAPPVITSPKNGDTVITGTPPIEGTGTPGYTVTVTDLGSPVCTAQVRQDGTWSCTPASPLNPGSHTITATQTDPADNTSGPSGPVTFTVAGVPSAPHLTATAGVEQVALTWSAPASDGGDAVIGYNLYRGTSAGGEASTPVNGGTLIKGLGYQDLGLTNGTTYYYVVKAVNRVGQSVASNEASATPTAAACPPPFLDVPSTSPFCQDIGWMKGEGITKGFPGNVYRPTSDTTRGQMAAFVYRRLNPGMADPSCTSKPFSDVAIDNPFCGDIAWLKAHGISGGYPDGTFHPAAAISRQGIAAFFFRMNHLGQPDPTCTVAPFTDVPVSNLFCGDITWMRDTGISYGYQGGTFRPQAQTTRQAMAALVHRMVTMV